MKLSKKLLISSKNIFLRHPSITDQSQVLWHGDILLTLKKGEACQNRVMFKQFLMSGAMQFCQVGWIHRDTRYIEGLFVFSPFSRTAIIRFVYNFPVTFD